MRFRLIKRRRFARIAAAAALIGALGMGGVGAPAEAQQLQRTERHKNWSVFVQNQGGPKYCYAATTPTKTSARRDGRAIDSITRDKAFLMVTTFPEQNAVNEVSVRVGFPIDAKKTATLRVGAKTFQMFSDGEDAWSERPELDKDIVAAFRAGATATVTTISTRGTEVTDEFSLVGFTDAVNSVRRLCR